MADKNMLDLSELEEKPKTIRIADSIADGKDKGVAWLKKSIRPILLTALILALFFYEYGRLVVRDEPLWVILGNIAILVVAINLAGGMGTRGGGEYGMLNPEYLKAKQAHHDTVRLIDSDEQTKSLRAKCEEFNREQYNAALRGILRSVALTEAEFDTYKKLSKKELLKCEKITLRQKKAVIKAARLNIPGITLEYLQSGYEEPRGVRHKKRKYRHIKKSAGKIVMSVILGYFAIEVITGLTIAAVGLFLFKALAIIYEYFDSYYIAYNEYRFEKTEEYKDKSNILRSFGLKQEEQSATKSGTVDKAPRAAL